MCDYRIDEPSDDDGVDDVGLVAATFGSGTRDNGGRCGRKGPLKDPVRVVLRPLTDFDACHKEIGSTDEVTQTLCSFSIGQRITDGPPDDGCHAGIQQVLSTDVEEEERCVTGGP